MCCSGAKWKREVVQDHKFDFVDVHEYRTTSFWTRLQYALVYVFVIKSVLVYVSDVYTAIAMLANNYWSANILSESGNSSTIKVPFTIGKWIFFGCIIFSFLLLAWESRKARMIIRSRDISYAFTNLMANNYYTLKSYDHFCFFSQINNSKKKKDEFAFFVFFTFKGWKRLLLADAPRQVINGLTLYSFGKAFNFTTDLSKYYNDDQGHFSFIRAGVLCTMIFTVVIWCGSAILLAIAAVMYIPLLCYIQGNLKEYCCHKIDKRIAELMKRKTKKRLAREAELAKREAAGDFRHLQDKRGRFREGHAPLPQPTLPTISLADDELYGDTKSEVSGGASRYGSQRRGTGRDGPAGGNYAYQNDAYNVYPPVPSMPDMPFGSAGYADPAMQAHYAQYQQHHGPGGDMTGVGMNMGNDSFASISAYNDDKASIVSRDPLLHPQQYMGGAHYPYGYDPHGQQRGFYPHSRKGSRDALSDIGGPNASDVSLTKAPSYRTREDDDPHAGYAPDDAYGGQQDIYTGYAHTSGFSPNMQEKQAAFEQDVRQGHTDHPQMQMYAATAPYLPQIPHQQHANQRQLSRQDSVQDQQSYVLPAHNFVQSPTVLSPAQSLSRGQAGQASNLPQARPRQMSDTDAQLRGVSVAGRSDVSTMYFGDDPSRDRISMADSHTGAFDLDEYSRQSMFANLGGPNDGGPGRLANVDEGDEDQHALEEVRSNATNAQSKYQLEHEQGYRRQQDWQR